MDASIITALPNLGVGVASIMALVYISMNCKKSQTEFLKEMKEENNSFRDLEKEVRHSIMSQLQKNTDAFEKVMLHIKNHE